MQIVFLHEDRVDLIYKFVYSIISNGTDYFLKLIK